MLNECLTKTRKRYYHWLRDEENLQREFEEYCTGKFQNRDTKTNKYSLTYKVCSKYRSKYTVSSCILLQWKFHIKELLREKF